MVLRRLFSSLAGAIFFAVAVLLSADVSWAQLTTSAAGVQIDAQGVLQMNLQNDPQLAKKKFEQAKAQLDPKLAKASALRKVSLNRLEAAIVKNQGKVTDEMANLAGLTRLQYVFYYPETHDIVVAGPAEGYVGDLTGRMVGLDSGRAVLQLEDMIVALRAFSPEGKAAQVIGCSIDPTPEGLARMQAFLKSIPHTNPGPVKNIVQGLKESLGQHSVRVDGVSNKTHFAQVLVEADYRMKLIGIGLERPSVNIPSFVSVATGAEIGKNALQRWFFVPNYECLRVADDNMAMELVGDTVKLVGESEVVSGGNREGTGKQGKGSETYTTAFTKQYADLAKKTPVYGQLRNLIDMSVAAAFIQQNRWYDQAGWKMETFGNEQKLAVEHLQAPTKVDSTINAISKGNTLLTPIGGGVVINPRTALKAENLLKDDRGYVKSAHDKLDLTKLPENQWWWD